MTSQKTDIHQDITDQIITLLERVDIDDYQPPFASLATQGLPENPTTGNQYQGVNILSLWFNQEVKNFTSNEWATFNQWKTAGANVRKGEKGSRIIFYKTLIHSDKNEHGKIEERKVPMLRTYTVFNANQVDNYNYTHGSLPSQIDKVRRIDLVDAFCKGTGADIRGNKNGAYYSTKKDCINMPPTASFLDTKYASATENYYATLLHELTHWTGAQDRLNRDWDDIATNQTTYAFEELIAELGAAFLCAQYGIAQTLAPDHAIYIKSWLKALRNDKTHVFKAAAQAMKATQYLNDLNVEAQSYETIL
ncbi:ArdC family protein [Kordia sp. SMS9]|uniref:ArdC family protein n=1 Tax=Kordia sp. SMS9 TaxID=2282170 RepID=UPI0013B3DBB3|nr:zincin-like metallopeptidase domain-containing protein [Kordia sp. SMS9]